MHIITAGRRAINTDHSLMDTKSNHGTGAILAWKWQDFYGLIICHIRGICSGIELSEPAYNDVVLYDLFVTSSYELRPWKIWGLFYGGEIFRN